MPTITITMGVRESIKEREQVQTHDPSSSQLAVQQKRERQERRRQDQKWHRDDRQMATGITQAGSGSDSRSEQSRDLYHEIISMCDEMRRITSRIDTVLGSPVIFTGYKRFHPRHFQDLLTSAYSLSFALATLRSACDEKGASFAKYFPAKTQKEILLLLNDFHKYAQSLPEIFKTDPLPKIAKTVDSMQMWTIAERIDFLNSSWTDLVYYEMTFRFINSAGQLLLLEDVSDLLHEDVRPAGYLADLQNLEKYAATVQFVQDFLRSGTFGTLSPSQTVRKMIKDESRCIRWLASKLIGVAGQVPAIVPSLTSLSAGLMQLLDLSVERTVELTVGNTGAPGEASEVLRSPSLYARQGQAEGAPE